MQELARPSRAAALSEELAKIPAFFRRDLLVLWSYRTAFFSDWANLFVQILVFYFVGRIVPADALPRFDGRPVSYFEFVAVALILTSFMQVTLSRLVGVVQSEQLMGTLDSLFVTPTAPITFMAGSVAYDVLYVPLRTAVFMLITGGFLGVDYNLGGLLPTAVILLVFLPFTWGLARAHLQTRLRIPGHRRHPPDPGLGGLLPGGVPAWMDPNAYPGQSGDHRLGCRPPRSVGNGRLVCDLVERPRSGADGRGLAGGRDLGFPSGAQAGAAARNDGDVLR
jgi:hypothetical protein